MFKHILIPTDGSPVAAKAIQAGITLAAEMGAKVTGYYAIEPPPTHLYGEGYLAERRLVDELEHRATDIARRSIEEVETAARAAGVKFDSDIGRSVQPYRGIIDAAEKHGCDAIVMASNGHRGLTGLLLGSVTHKVLTHTQIPVLVYR